MSLASDSSETIQVLITKLGTVTASDMLMHHVLIILTLTFIQGHTDLNHENNKCMIISNIIQALPITFAAMIVRLKVYMTTSSPITLPFIQGHTCVSNVSTVNLQYIGQYFIYYIQTWQSGSPIHGWTNYALARFANIVLHARS